MTLVHPFRGLRYNPSVVGDLSQVVTQPYDRIGPDEERAYLSRSPYSFVRLIGTRIPPCDDGDYARRAALLREWIATGILVEDERPGIYLYRQTFRWAADRGPLSGRRDPSTVNREPSTALTRQGLIALLDLAQSGAKAHEHTLRGPKEDRLKLFRATEAHLEHIFLLYRDPLRRASAAAEAAIAGRPPDLTAKDDFANTHELWYIPDHDAVRAVQQALLPLELYIADGHHRFETAQAFMRECLAKGWKPASPQSFTALPVTLVNVEEPGCVIRPTPRVVRDLPAFSPQAFLEAAQGEFAVGELPSLAAARAALAVAAGNRHTFILYADGKFWSLALRREDRLDHLIQGAHPPAWKRLDVAILHKAILEPILGIDDEALARQANVDYAHTDEEAIALVDAGKGQAAFLLNPTRVEEVLQIADLGVSMPQKSTDFYPKLLSGLVAMTMEIAKP
ncbi:MAG TPA: DUF1015 domain-containing protein [Candidatus Acetothermia bacterium]|nr:DUF1015 domain-containing protein [Candidatus Acetothermia bacterium]